MGEENGHKRLTKVQMWMAILVSATVVIGALWTPAKAGYNHIAKTEELNVERERIDDALIRIAGVETEREISATERAIWRYEEELERNPNNQNAKRKLRAAEKKLRDLEAK